MKFLYLLLLPLLFASCHLLDSEYTDQITCRSRNNIDISFVGFDSTEIDTIELKTYKPDGSFSELTSVKAYKAFNGVYHPGYSGIDTSIKAKDWIIDLTWPLELHGIAKGPLDDVEIVIPAIDRKYRFHSFVDTGDYEQTHRWSHAYDPAPLCFRRLASYKLDGVEKKGSSEPAELIK